MREDAAALAYLEAHHVMTLATSGPAGPWAAAVFYASEGFALTFLSSPRSRHAADLEADPRVAAAIHEDYHDWPPIQGLQLEGRARLLQGAEAEAAAALFARKFPLVADPTQAEVRRALERVGWYRLEPSAVYFVDNARGFGRRERVL